MLIRTAISITMEMKMQSLITPTPPLFPMQYCLISYLGLLQGMIFYHFPMVPRLIAINLALLLKKEHLFLRLISINQIY